MVPGLLSQGVRMRKIRVLSLVPAVGLLVAATMAFSAPAANAYGPAAVYQIGISENCNNPSLCGGGGGGFWGWAEVDNDNTVDAQFADCGHLVRGANSGYPPPDCGAGALLDGGAPGVLCSWHHVPDRGGADPREVAVPARADLGRYSSPGVRSIPGHRLRPMVRGVKPGPECDRSSTGL